KQRRFRRHDDEPYREPADVPDADRAHAHDGADEPGQFHRFVVAIIRRKPARRKLGMIESLAVIRSGLEGQQTQMDVISNNLANINTPGFKRMRAVFQDLLYQNQAQAGAFTSQATVFPSGLQKGTGANVVSTEPILTQGSLQQTGNALDLAINGSGFFQILLPTGQVAYTRDGSFQINAQGQ